MNSETDTLAPAKTMVPPLSSIEVDVIATQGNGQIDWDLDIKTHGHGQGGKRIAATPGIGYKIRFDLVNRSHLDVRFDASGPIFVREGSDIFCPTRLDSKQIMIDSCKDDELVVIDWNYEELVLNYQLNFVTDVGKAVNPYDPIIDNGGGGTKPLF